MFVPWDGMFIPWEDLLVVWEDVSIPPVAAIHAPGLGVGFPFVAAMSTRTTGAKQTRISGGRENQVANPHVQLTEGVTSSSQERSKVNRGRSTRCRSSRDKTGRSRSWGCRSTATRRFVARRGRAPLVFHRSRHVRTLGLPGHSHRRGRPRIRRRGLRRRSHCLDLPPRRAKPHRFPARSPGRRRRASLVTNHPDVVKCRTPDVVKGGT